jgi:hypothetical protein
MRKGIQKLVLPIWLLVFGLLVGIGVLSLSAIQVKAEAATGQSTATETGALVEEPKAEQSLVGATQAVDYYLPYPGILPDHPLYWLKMIRDRVQLWLITKPLPKAEKFLLYADKRLGAGWALIDGNKKDLGVTVVTKAEKYLERAITIAEGLNESGNETAFKEKLYKASLKHQEVLLNLIEKVADKDKDLLRQMLIIPEKGVELFGGLAKDLGGVSQGEESEKEPSLVLLKIDFGDGEEVAEEVEAVDALEGLTKLAVGKGLVIKTKSYDFGTLVEEIGGRANSDEKAWIYFINDEAGTVAADKVELSPGDVVEWRYIKPIF